MTDLISADVGSGAMGSIMRDAEPGPTCWGPGRFLPGPQAPLAQSFPDADAEIDGPQEFPED